jgi:hypothetical protein
MISTYYIWMPLYGNYKWSITDHLLLMPVELSHLQTVWGKTRDGENPSHSNWVVCLDRIVLGSTLKVSLVPGSNLKVSLVAGSTLTVSLVPGSTLKVSLCSNHDSLDGDNPSHSNWVVCLDRIVPGSTLNVSLCSNHDSRDGKNPSHSNWVMCLDRIVPGFTLKVSLVPGSTLKVSLVPGSTLKVSLVPRPTMKVSLCSDHDCHDGGNPSHSNWVPTKGSLVGICQESGEAMGLDLPY